MDSRRLWRKRAACRGQPVDLFFPMANKPREDAYAEGKKFCAACPVTAECYEESSVFVKVGDQYGLFGGLSPAERRRKRAGIEAPRFSPAAIAARVRQEDFNFE